MQLSEQGAKFVSHHEGWVGRWYADPVGVGTIGTGFTWASSAFRKWWAKNRPGQKFGPGATMTKAEGAEVLSLLMEEEYGAAVNKLLGSTKVPQHVFDGMSSVTFNAGPGTLTDRWAKAVKAGDYQIAGELLKTTRVTAKGKRLQGLVNRRLDEAEMIMVGDYTIGRPRAAAVDAMADGILMKGERGEAVRKLQVDLQKLGFYKDGKVDDIFGHGTEAAVMEFQRSVGLDDDGYAGPKTLAAISSALSLPTIVPTPTTRPGGLSEIPAIEAPTEKDDPVVLLPSDTIVYPPKPADAPMTLDQYLTVIETAAAGIRKHYGGSK